MVSSRQGHPNLFADKQTDCPFSAGRFRHHHWRWGHLFAWTRLDQSRYALPTPAKMALGMIILGLGFIVLAIADAQTAGGAKVGPQWLFIVYILHTMGELCLSPIGLSMVTKLAPVRLMALMMGVWYTANATANYLAGILEDLLKGSSFPLYWFLVASSIGAGLLLLLITPWLKKLMHAKG
jgi:POT family proton-dependent oligopeptide transporter